MRVGAEKILSVGGHAGWGSSTRWGFHTGWNPHPVLEGLRRTPNLDPVLMLPLEPGPKTTGTKAREERSF